MYSFVSEILSVYFRPTVVWISEVMVVSMTDRHLFSWTSMLVRGERKDVVRAVEKTLLVMA